jgi:hypothetical protein
VSAIWLLMGLLLLAYLGSSLVGGRGFGLASGVEYVVLGFVLGPPARGFLERDALSAFDPVANVAVGWLMLILGVGYGTTTGGRRVRASRLAGSSIMSLASGAAVFGAAWLFLHLATTLPPGERLLAAGGIGAASAETTRYAVRWVLARHRAEGPVATLAGDLAESDDLVPALAAAVFFAREPSAPGAIPLPWVAWVAITLGLGLVLGALAALLLGKTFQLGEAWGVLLGMSLLAIGATTRLGISTLGALFTMGATLSALSSHRREIAAMIAPTERAVMLPALLLAGAHVDFGAAPWVPWVVPIALVTRVIAKSLAGLGVLAASPAARPAGPFFGAGLLSAGALSMSIGLAFALRFPGPVGASVLAVAASVTLFGELAGPASLRAALARAGEIPEAPASPQPAAAPAEEIAS